MLIGATQRTVWERMKTENHPFYQIILSNAVGAMYNDAGRWGALAYTITGDAKYVPASYAAWKAHWPYFGSNADSMREFTIDNALTYELLKPALTSVQEAEARAKLIAVADKIVKGTLTGDSDQTSCTYLGLLCIDAVLGTSYRTGNFNDGATTKPVGGYTSTGADRATMRNCISYYVKMSEGGMWPEGTMYNPNTVGHVLRACAFLANHLGVDHFPEVTAFRHAYARVMMQEFLPNLKEQSQWGDIQRPHALDFATLCDIFAVVSTLETGDLGDGLRQLEAEVYAANNVKLQAAGLPLYARYLWFANPYGAKREWQSLAGTGMVARGVGRVMARQADRALAFHFNDFRNGVVDHWQGLTSGDLRLTRDGRWPLDHPLAYATDNRFHNLTVIANRGPNGTEASGIVGYAHQPGHFTYASGLACGLGPDITPGYWNPPPTYCHENRRSVFWLMDDDEDIIVVHDRRHADDPRTQKMKDGTQALDRYYPSPKAAMTNMLALKTTCWHSPMAPMVSADKKQLQWQTGATVVKLEQVLPATSPTVITVDEKTGLRDDTGQALVPALSANMYEYQRKFLTCTINGGAGFDTVLSVLTAYEGTQADGNVYTPLEAGDMEGVTITRPGKPDVVVLVSRTPGPTLTNTFDSKGVLINDRTKFDTVKQAAMISTPPAFTVTPNSRLYLADLDAAVTEVIVNGAPVALTREGDLALATAAPPPALPPAVTPAQEKLNRMRDLLQELDNLIP